MEREKGRLKSRKFRKEAIEISEIGRLVARGRGVRALVCSWQLLDAICMLFREAPSAYAYDQLPARN